MQINEHASVYFNFALARCFRRLNQIRQNNQISALN